MRRRLHSIATSALLLLTTPAYADKDTEQTILLLPDAEAECRYIQSLLDNAHSSLQGLHRMREEAEGYARSGETMKGAAVMKVAMDTLPKTAQKQALDATGAVNTVKIKRGTLPPCAEELQRRANHDIWTVMDFQRVTINRLGELTAQLRAQGR
jgi:hypothetical protein